MKISKKRMMIRTIVPLALNHNNTYDDDNIDANHFNYDVKSTKMSHEITTKKNFRVFATSATFLIA